MYYNPTPVPVGETSTEPITNDFEVVGVTTLVADHMSFTFRPETGTFTELRHYKVDLSACSYLCGGAQFYTAAAPVYEAVTGGAATYGAGVSQTDPSLWRWLGPLIGVLGLLLLALLILLCCKFCGVKKRQAFAATSKDISEVSLSSRDLDESVASMSGTNPGSGTGFSSSRANISQPSLRSSYAAVPSLDNSGGVSSVVSGGYGGSSGTTQRGYSTKGSST